MTSYFLFLVEYMHVFHHQMSLMRVEKSLWKMGKMVAMDGVNEKVVEVQIMRLKILMAAAKLVGYF